MEINNSTKAIDEINFIKNIMLKTTTSLIPLSKIFIQIGIITFIISISFKLLSSIPIENTGSISNIQSFLIYFFNIIILPITAIVVIILCKNIISKNTLYGISKHILTLWLYIILSNVFLFITFVIISFIFISKNKLISISFINYITIIQIFTYSIGLLSIKVFSGLKFPLFLSIFYIFTGISLIVLNEFYILIHLIYFINILIMPVTLIITGLYLMLIKAKVV